MRHLSPTVTLCGVTNTHTLGQYGVNKPTFDWQVTFHYGGIAEAQSKSKQTRHTQCHSQDTPRRQTDRQTDRTGKICFRTSDWNSRLSTVILIPFKHKSSWGGSEKTDMLLGTGRNCITLGFDQFIPCCWGVGLQSWAHLSNAGRCSYSITAHCSDRVQSVFVCAFGEVKLNEFYLSWDVVKHTPKAQSSRSNHYSFVLFVFTLIYITHHLSPIHYSLFLLF